MTQRKKVTIATIAIATMILTTGLAGVAQAHMGDSEASDKPHLARPNAHNRKQMLETRLNKAVEEGKITSTQKDELLSKMKENHDQASEIRHSDKSREEKKSAIKSLHDSMKQWLSDHGIDPTIILPKHFRR